MATETLILRPIFSGMATSSSYSGVRVPEDCPIEQLYLLVSEETPDNEASYYVAKTAVLGLGSGPCFGFEVSDGFLQHKIPKKIAVCFTAAGYNSTDKDRTLGAIIVLSVASSGNYNTGNCGEASVGTDWDYCELEVPEELVEDFYRYILENPGQIQIMPFDHASSNKNDDGTSITQLYLKLTYELEDPSQEGTAIYVKENNSWGKITGEVYQKINNSWTKQTLLSDTTKYIIRKL